MVNDTTEPVPVEVDGHDGLYVELSVSAGCDISECRGQELIVWHGPGGETPRVDHLRAGLTIVPTPILSN